MEKGPHSTSRYFQTPSPWYKQYYVWLLIAFPTIAVIGGIITLILALQTDDGLVVDDYYKQGLEINQTFNRDQAATDKNIGGDLFINEDNNFLRVVLRGNENFIAPQIITVSFIHSTRSGFDQILELHSDDSGLYEGNLPVLQPGVWNVIIEAEDWRLLERYRHE